MFKKNFPIKFSDLFGKKIEEIPFNFIRPHFTWNFPLNLFFTRKSFVDVTLAVCFFESGKFSTPKKIAESEEFEHSAEVHFFSKMSSK